MIDVDIFLPFYPEIIDSDFNKKIYEKKEFNDQKLLEYNEKNNNFGLKKNQEFITRYFSAYTPYDGLLLFHEMGLGKTFASIGSIEKMLNSKDSSFDGAVIFANGDKLLDNFKNEVFLYTKKYNPTIETHPGIFDKNGNIYDKEHYRKQQLKNLNVNYEFKTFRKFASTFRTLKDKTELLKNYSNKYIIIDEIQNIRDDEKKYKENVYKSFYEFLHTINNSKVLLLSGTPMKDSVKEIADIMNLIIPRSMALPVQSKFLKDYFSLENEIYNIRDDKRDYLKSIFKGRVSYMKSASSSVKKIFEGDRIYGLDYITVFETTMSPFQSQHYRTAFLKDTTKKDKKVEDDDEEEEYDEEEEDGGEDKEKKQGIYTNSTDSSLFVFPDGSYGKKGFTKYVSVKRNNINNKLQKSLSPQFKSLFTKAKTVGDKLKILYTYSTKYATLIEKLLDSFKTKKSFVYCKSVSGGGTTLLSLILQLFGFSELVNPNEKRAGKRFVNFTGEIDKKFMKNLMYRINQKDNSHGEIASIIIGSKAISEGFSFMDIQEVHVLTPHWNYAEIEQAIARGYRYKSHTELLRQYADGEIEEEPSLRIFQYVSIPDDKSEAIDIKLYKRSEIKDVSIKRVERLIKESAVDCSLNYEILSKRPGTDFQRDCEYTNCEYTCDGEIDLNTADIDYSTDYIYFFQNSLKYNKIKKYLKNILKETFNINYNNVNYEMKNLYYFIVLQDLVNNKDIIMNKYGKKCYLKEHKNIFYLIDVDELDSADDHLVEYYNKHPKFFNFQGNESDVFIDTIKSVNAKVIPKIIGRIFETDIEDTEDIDNLIVQIIPEYQEILLENCILSKIKDTTKNIEHRDYILEYFSGEYKEINKIWFSWLLYADSKENTEDLRCFDSYNNTWRNCESKEVAIFKNYRDKLIKNVEENNKVGFYGFYTVEKGKRSFLIKRTDVDENKKKSTKGRVCETINKFDLIKFIIDLDVKLPTDYNRWKKTVNEKDHKNLLDKLNKKFDLTKDKQLESVYWYKISKKSNPELCNLISSELEKKNLVITRK